jgi:hypothetical protein
MPPKAKTASEKDTSQTKERGQVFCMTCRTSWDYKTRKPILRSATHRCGCQGKTKEWNQKKATLVGTWGHGRYTLFDQRTGEGIEECTRQMRDDAAAACRRYEKGKETAFSPTNASRELVHSHGVLVKHQDGSPIRAVR